MTWVKRGGHHTAWWFPARSPQSITLTPQEGGWYLVSMFSLVLVLKGGGCGGAAGAGPKVLRRVEPTIESAPPTAGMLWVRPSCQPKRGSAAIRTSRAGGGLGCPALVASQFLHAAHLALACGCWGERLGGYHRGRQSISRAS